MAQTPTDDPYYSHAKITHSAVTTADSAIADGAIFPPALGCDVIKCRASLASGTAVIRLKEYAGKLSAKLNTETWVNGPSFEINTDTTLTPSWKFDTTAALVAIFVESKSDAGALTIEAVLAAQGVASN